MTAENTDTPIVPRPPASDRPSGRRVAIVCALILAALPALRMARVSGRSSRTQYGDYWPMLDSMTGADGSWRLGGFLAFRNEHPILVPKVLYALNVELFSGSNRTLGSLVILIVIAQVIVIGVLARGSNGMGRWLVASVVVTSSALLFAQHGAWNFVKAMSGTAWLTANLLAIAALLARTGLADGSTALGSIEPMPPLTARLDRIGHYPFTDRFDADCGALDQIVTTTERPPNGVAGRVLREVATPWAAGGRSFLGVVDPRGRKVECVVVLDRTDRVVGAGVLSAGAEGRVSFNALSPDGQGLRVAAGLSGMEEFVVIDRG